jgi:hypothetical protein
MRQFGSRYFSLVINFIKTGTLVAVVDPLLITNRGLCLFFFPKTSGAINDTIA